MKLTVYLSGEIHSSWREEIIKGIKSADLDMGILAPVTDHAASDNVGEAIIGSEQSAFWKDQKAAKINAIRIRTFIEKADVVVVKFGDKYKQWNTAFDAGYAAALGKKLIIIHPVEFTHALKEVDAAALAVVEKEDQVVEILKYVTQ